MAQQQVNYKEYKVSGAGNKKVVVGAKLKSFGLSTTGSSCYIHAPISRRQPFALFTKFSELVQSKFLGCFSSPAVVPSRSGGGRSF